MTISEYAPSITREAKAKMRGLPRRGKWVGVAIGVALVAALVWHVAAGWLQGRPKTPPPPPVMVAAARAQPVTILDHTIATVMSPATVQVNAQVAGKLLAAYFQEGQMVHKGDPLFLIDPTPFRNALNQARAQLSKDQAQAQSLSNDEQRYVALYAQGAASQQQRDQAVAAAKGARAVVESDTAAVGTAEENLGYSRIVSPIDGKTGPIAIQPGNLVSVAGATLVTVAQIQPIKLSFFLPQSDLAQIQDQMAAGKLTATVPMPGVPGGVEKAPVNFVSNIVNAASGTIELRATFANTDLRLVPGQTLTVAVSLRDIPHAVVVPRDAVNQGPDGSFVLVVDKQSVAQSRAVTVLNDDGVQDAIKGAVKPSDRVVTEGQLRVNAGQKVAAGQAVRGKDGKKNSPP